MNPFFLVVLGLFIWGAIPASAEVYRYVDENGVPHFTNELSSVPEDKRLEVTVQPEDQYTEPPVILSPPNDQPDDQRNAADPALRNSRVEREKALKKRKSELESEYHRLLAEKQSLDDNKMFQSRRHKRKYQNRPSIKALVEKEQAVNERLQEIETEIDKIGKQL